MMIRPARREDCGDIARLFLVSSDGLAAYIWGQLAAPGEAPIEVGHRRYAREGVAFSYRNCLVVEAGPRVVGMMHAFVMPARGEADAEEEPDPVLRPYAELEDPGSLYVSGIALDPERRGNGLGTRLLAAAHDRARDLGLERVSLICFEGNEGALRLYRRQGYREEARRPIVPHPSLRYEDGDALLLVKQLG